MRITLGQLILAEVILLLVLLAQSRCQTQGEQVHQFAVAIARTEGFYAGKNTIPARLHNPGDICTRLKHAYPGQTGVYKNYAVFKNDKWGWAALESQIRRVIDGTSKKYDQSMTMTQIAKVYAENWRYWGKTVCQILHIDQRMTFEEYFGLAPRVRMVPDEIPVWLSLGRNTLSHVQPLPPMSPQVRRTSGWLVLPMSEWPLEEISR